jgi:1,4-dihydroxy-2-naphthoyl-CoA hydrolase
MQELTYMDLKEINAMNKNTLMENLGIEYTELSKGRVVARMPVDMRTKQPMGILHGGASLALAETVAGVGSYLLVDPELYDVRGMAVNANHIGSVSQGYVFAHAEIIHKGVNSHIWNITISDDGGRAVSICRFTNMILKK